MDYGYYDYAYSGGDEATLVVLLIMLLAVCIGAFIGWLITLYPRYYMVKTSKVGPAWSAFIPIWQDIQMFKTAGWKGWYYWVYLGVAILTSWIPIVNYLSLMACGVFMCITFWRISANFGLGTVGRILSLFLGYWVYWYVALTKKPYCNMYATTAQNNYQAQNQNWYQNNGQTNQNQNWYQQAPQQGQPQNQNQNQNWYNNNQQ